MAPARKLPSFIKNFLGEQFCHKTKIPREFLQYFHGSIPHKCRLQTSSQTWLVEMGEVNNNFFFQKGWKEFVQGNGLKYGHFLVFHYAGNSGFHVDIFGKNTCGELFLMPETEEANEEDDDNVPLDISDDSPVPSSPPQKKCKTSSSGKERTKYKEAQYWSKSEMKRKDRGGNSSSQIRRQEHDHLGRNHNYQMWETHMRAEVFRVKNPSSFLVAVQPSYIKSHFVWLPQEFTMLVKPFIHQRSRDVILRVSDGEARTWQAKWTCDTSTYRSKLHGHRFYKFMHDNNLEEGDLCVFKLIKTSSLHLFKKDMVLIEVAIFHVKGATTSTVSPDISHHDHDDEDNEGDDENEDEEGTEDEEEDEEETETETADGDEESSI